MDKLFLSVLNMSLTASYVIAALILARLLLKKAPKIISYVMWAVAGFRLLFPFSLESVFSLIPFKSEPIPADIATQLIPRVDSGINMVDNAVSQVLPAAAPSASINPLQVWLIVGAYLWLTGIAIMLIYSIVSIVLLKRRLSGAILVGDSIYEDDNLKTPFVLGLFKVKIYIPAGLSAEEKRYIILHELTHIRRHDYMVKFLAYFILCLHWFNPFVWVAFLLMGADMEMSCDERVLKEIGKEAKKNYSLSLLSLATERRIIGGSPLAFGEGGMQERIKNVLNFKKPSRIIITMAVALAIVLSVGFVVNRIDTANSSNWETYHLPSYTYDRVTFHTDTATYSTSFQAVTAILTNKEMESGLMCGRAFTLVKQLGEDWRIVPFTEGVAFEDIAINLTVGESETYTLTPDMLSVKLDAGNYRIITDVWYANEPSPTTIRNVWADFTINEHEEEMIITSDEIDLIKLGTIAFDTYMALQMSEQTPISERIASYNLNDISVLAGDINEFCISLNYDFTTDNDSYVNPARGAKGKGTWPDNYWEFRIKHIENDQYEIVSIGTGGGGQGLAPYSAQQKPLEPIAAEWSPELNISVDMTQVDYASDDIVIFHDYFGMFVYDLDSFQIIRTLDLKSLNCDATQGDDYCDVTVSTDGNTVQLHRMSSDNMYIYTVSDNTLREAAFERMSNQFGSRFVPIEELIGPEEMAHYSHNAVKFETGEYGLLYTYDWTLGSLSYRRGDLIYALFDIKEE